MEKQMNKARSERMPTLPELFVGSKSSLRLSQLQVNNQFNNQSTRGKSMTTLGNKHPRRLPPLSSDGKTINLVPIAYVLETS
jgi:hypothetical protein